jgi:hypothetical protein
MTQGHCYAKKGKIMQIDEKQVRSIWERSSEEPYRRP